MAVSAAYEEAVALVQSLRATCWPPKDGIELRMWWGLYKLMVKFRRMEDSANA